MAARAKRRQSPVAATAAPRTTATESKHAATTNAQTAAAVAAESTADDQLPPLFLQAVVICCSGLWLVIALRDFATTGKAIFGSYDDAYLKFTGATKWYDDSRGWKSQMGGFSAVASVSTDQNDMGGFFVRKLTGCTMLGLQLHKLLPLVLLTTPDDAAPFGRHYGWILLSGVASNLCLAAFLASYWPDFQNADALHIPASMIGCAVLESLVFLYYYATKCWRSKTRSSSQQRPARAFAEGKTPKSLVSNIVARTVAICSSAMLVYGLRDWLFGGQTIPYIPYDDLYLEWTNAYLHSPPTGSPEYQAQGLGAAGFYVGDQYVSRLAGLQLTLLCLYKLLSAWTIRLGPDGRSGAVTAGLVWKPAALANLLLLFQLRIFTSAAASASCHFRYHLMVLAYEAFIVGLYAFF